MGSCSAAMFLFFVIPFNLIYNMTISEKLNFCLLTQRSGGEGVCGQNNCCIDAIFRDSI